jgi:hypothetical protein
MYHTKLKVPGSIPASTDIEKSSGGMARLAVLKNVKTQNVAALVYAF